MASNNYNCSTNQYIEESYYIINQDLRDKQGNERSDVLDLFNFETIDDVRNEAAVEDAIFCSHATTSIVVSNRDLRSCQRSSEQARESE
jgi:hypothetical protein